LIYSLERIVSLEVRIILNIGGGGLLDSIVKAHILLVKNVVDLVLLPEHFMD